jgi:hypothetical protein
MIVDQFIPFQHDSHWLLNDECHSCASLLFLLSFLAVSVPILDMRKEVMLEKAVFTSVETYRVQGPTTSLVTMMWRA